MCLAAATVITVYEQRPSLSTDHDVYLFRKPGTFASMTT